MKTNQKYALITGATSGIGFELAKLFAHNNYSLVIVAPRQDELDNTAVMLEVFGVDIIKIVRDLSKMEDVLSLCEEIKNKDILIDVLVNDAGQGINDEFKNTGVECELGVIQFNICATVVLTRHFLKGMLKRGHGKILNLDLVAGGLSNNWQAIYHAKKAFVLSFTAAIREELKNTGITLTTLMPGITDTHLFFKANLADVAFDGYKALMAGKEQAIAGIPDINFSLLMQ